MGSKLQIAAKDFDRSSDELYLTYGYYIDHNYSFVFNGIQWQQFIADIMSDFRSCASYIFS
jgi:hypothetical protein